MPAANDTDTAAYEKVCAKASELLATLRPWGLLSDAQRSAASELTLALMLVPSDD